MRTRLTERPDPLPASTSPAAMTIPEASAVLSRSRKRLGRTASVCGLVLVGASMATEPITWSLSLLGLCTVGLVHVFPLSRRVRQARALMRQAEAGAVLRQLEGAQLPPSVATTAAAVDPRLAAVDAVVARLAEHAADRRTLAFGQEVRRQLARVLDDARAVEQLRGAAPLETDARLAALRAQVDERIERLMGAVTEVYQAVLAPDDTTLNSVLERGEDVLRQLRARQEVDKLLGGQV